MELTKKDYVIIILSLTVILGGSVLLYNLNLTKSKLTNCTDTTVVNLEKEKK